jgi:multiple sugar transport system substrate-binding protein
VFRLTVAVGTALAAILAACADDEPGPAELTFAFGPDESGTLGPIIETFNETNDQDITVEWREMPRESDAYFAELFEDLEAGDSDIDVFAADVIWTGELAESDLVTDLTGRFRSEYDAEEFVPAARLSAGYQQRAYGVPWYTDAGVLLYRADLLADAGYDTPPETWDELRQIAAEVTAATDVPAGFIFQGADYEGGVANMLEHIWSFGGRVLTTQASVAGQFGENVMAPNVIVINSARTAEGLDHARQLITDGITPEAVTTFREVETDQAFAAGDAVFLRSWPLAVAVATAGGLELDQVGAAPLPVARPGDPSFSTLGGWNLMIAADSPHEAAAWEFIRYMVDEEQQRIRASDGAFLPTLETLYDDQELLDVQPVLAIGREAVENARIRPVSPRYSEISSRLSAGFQAALLGEEEGASIAARLQRELEQLVAS